jgi:hypothetical protein
MSGAIMSHLTKLGIVVKDDGGLLFALALTVFGCSTIVLFLRRHQIPFIGSRFAPARGMACEATTENQHQPNES